MGGRTLAFAYVRTMPLFGRKKPALEPTPEAVVVDEPLPERTPEEQLSVLLDGVRPMSPFGMQLNDVLGLTLCEDIVSDIDVPVVTTAKVEGYGIRAANIVGASSEHPIDLRLVGMVERRDVLPTQAVAPGGCVLVAEGAPVPKGVDAVVPLEDAEQTGRIVTFTFEAGLHQNLRLRGSDLADGQQLLPSGAVLDARSIGLLAEVGLDKVLVRPRPRVVVFSVGADLVAPGLPLTLVNQRYAGATALVAAAARGDGATVYPLDNGPQDAASLRQTITDQMIRADAMVILTDSESDSRLVTDVLGSIGSVNAAEVTMNARCVQASGRIGEDGLPVVVIPAGAVTACACYHLFVRPLLARLSAREIAEPCRRATVAEDLPGSADATLYLPALVTEEGIRPLSAVGSELAYDVVRANALLVVPRSGSLECGAEVEYLPLDAAPSA